MTHREFLLSSRIAGLMALAVFGVPLQAAEVTVNFAQPETYTDFTTSDLGPPEGQAQLMAELDAFLKRQGELHLPTEQTLEVTVTDIDLAGRFLPVGAGAGGDQKRIVKPVYFPTIKLEYVLRSGAGEVLSEGRETLKGMDVISVDSRSARARDDRLRYEKIVLENWLRDLGEDAEKG